ncbi:MAG: ParA family protein [Syntrophothermus sp.]|uniref:AAA family ATPase n=1 Tax=Syntrophothermus sp. TaxID=2736299 RepID=UPI00258067D6|nr:ParA family protein [Syntrophothermus sp.]NSW82729.1 ParA family protein [Syntrophothermus sp.]
MFCVIAAEKESCEIIKTNLERKFPDWLFEVATDANQLMRYASKRPDVLLISRHLPGEKPTELLAQLPVMFPATHIVLMVGVLNEEAKAYVRAAKKVGLENIVTGKLPGDKPYTIFAALTEARKELLEITGESLEFSEDFIEETEEAKQEPALTEPVYRKPEPRTDPASNERYDSKFFKMPGSRVIEKRPRKKGSIILVSSNKGGVGKTTVAISLALTITNAGIDTILCDLDLGAPDVATFFEIKNVPGIESLQGKRNLSHYINDLLVEKDGLRILPGVMNKTMPYFEPIDIAEIVEALAEECQVVVCDTPPEFWTKEYLEELFPRADLALSVVDQSKFSEVETRDYAPKLVMMGVTPDRIRIICNRYNPKLHNIRKVEAFFNHGFKKGKNLPRVIATIPEDWEEFVRKAYRGEIAGDEGRFSPWKQLAEKVAEDLNLPVRFEREKKGLLDFLKRRR